MLLRVLPAQDGTGTAAQGREVVGEQYGPYLAVLQFAKQFLAGVARVRVVVGLHVDDAQHLVAPRLVAGRHALAKGRPPCPLVMHHDVTETAAQMLPHQIPDGVATMATQPAVARGRPFGGCSSVDVETKTARRQVAVTLAVLALESLPTLTVAVEVHVDDDAVAAETDVQRVGNELGMQVGCQKEKKQWHEHPTKRSRVLTPNLHSLKPEACDICAVSYHFWQRILIVIYKAVH